MLSPVDFPKVRLEIVRKGFAYHGQRFYRDLLILIKYNKSNMREMTVKKLREWKNDDKSGEMSGKVMETKYV